jgi:hypothetical protein
MCGRIDAFYYNRVVIEKIIVFDRYIGIYNK